VTRVEQATAKAEAAQAELDQLLVELDALDLVEKRAGLAADARAALAVREGELVEAMQAASAAGVSLRTIGKAAGVSAEWARKLIAKQAA
jgi:DNA-directed RNA polymerase specialized sigma24 family protein